MGYASTDSVPLSGANVLVVGFAREGHAVARFLAERGANVTITDSQPAYKLENRIEPLEKLGITFRLGEHPNSLLTPKHVDFLVVSPGVPLNIPFLQKARSLRLPLTTESRLFCQRCPAPITGISGSSGKTTTTTLVGKMLEASGYTAHVGGNIGQPLISRLAEVKAQDRVVMELSSFQLEYYHADLNLGANIPPEFAPLFEGWSPTVGALLNITPNHLDRHKTMAAYTRAKRSLVDYLGSKQIAVMGLDNPITRQIGQALPSAVRWFSRETEVTSGAMLKGDTITLVEGGVATPVCSVTDLKLRGEHNQANVLAACAIAGAMGASVEGMAAVASTFTGVAHRLELVAQKNGVSYINDSIATSPERLNAALNAFTEPIILLAGGKDKDLPWDETARLILRKTKCAILFGHAKTLIATAIEKERGAENDLTVEICDTLDEAVSRAEELAQPGDVVLLSPGGTSYDAYPDFAARGEHFRQLVMRN